MLRPKVKIRDLTLPGVLDTLLSHGLSPALPEHLLHHFSKAGFDFIDIWDDRLSAAVIRNFHRTPQSAISTLTHYVGANGSTLLCATSAGRNILLGLPLPEDLLTAYYTMNSASGINLLTIFDALNDITNLETPIAASLSTGATPEVGICVCGSFDIFSDAYYVEKARQAVALGAERITLMDSFGLTPTEIASVITALKNSICKPVGLRISSARPLKLASSLMAIIAGANVVDTVVARGENFAELPLLDPLLIFCLRLGLQVDIQAEGLSALRRDLLTLSRESGIESQIQVPSPDSTIFNTPLSPQLLALFDSAIEFAQASDEASLSAVCQEIEKYFSSEMPQPGSNLPRRLRKTISEHLSVINRTDLIPLAENLVEKVREDAGNPALYYPLDQAISAQAVMLALDRDKGLTDYHSLSKGFVPIITGRYGVTPGEIDPKLQDRVSVYLSQEESQPDDEALNCEIDIVTDIISPKHD